jgi:hypothetical protein
MIHGQQNIKCTVVVCNFGFTVLKSMNTYKVDYHDSFFYLFAGFKISSQGYSIFLPKNRALPCVSQYQKHTEQSSSVHITVVCEIEMLKANLMSACCILV